MVQRLTVLLVIVVWSATTYTYCTCECSSNYHRLNESTRTVQRTCHPWATTTSNNTCECPEYSEHVRPVKCMDNGSGVFLEYCYCMSHSELYDTTVIGYCVFRCHVWHSVPGAKHYTGDYRYKVANVNANNSDINHDLCSDLEMNRTGQMCGSCIEGYSPPAYSYSLACVNCSSNYEYNWLKYIAVAYLPLTAFFVFIIIFRLSISSGRVSGYILTLQIISTPAFIRYMTIRFVEQHKTNTVSVVTKVMLSLYGILNLDFFRFVYTPFCIHPKWSTLQTLALNYTIALYPLLLILVTFTCVKLHDNYTTIVRMWRPFYKCFMKLRQEWDIRASLVEAFATFILLSYTKVLNTSLDLLTPISLIDQQGDVVQQCYLKTDGTVKYFGRQHLPYALLAIAMLFLFNILPLFLLSLYPCQCFQRCLNAFKIRRQALHTFVEVFQGSFQTHPQDFRHFAAVYLLIRFFNLLLLSVLNGMWYFPAASILMFLSAILVAIVKPHRSSLHSNIDAIMFACLGTAQGSFVALEMTHIFSVYYDRYVYGSIFWFSTSISFLYGAGLFIRCLLPHRVLKLFHAMCKKKARENNEEPRPYRLEHENEYAPLINTASYSLN